MRLKNRDKKAYLVLQKLLFLNIMHFLLANTLSSLAFFFIQIVRSYLILDDLCLFFNFLQNKNQHMRIFLKFTAIFPLNISKYIFSNSTSFSSTIIDLKAFLSSLFRCHLASICFAPIERGVGLIDLAELIRLLFIFVCFYCKSYND